MKTLKLHLGAHKTATTYIQSQLSLNSKRLNSEDVFIPMDRSRKTLTRAVKGKKWHFKNRRTLLRKLPELKGFSTLIISDENLLGIPNNLRDGTMYDNLHSDCLKIKKFLDDGETEFFIYFSIRNYRKFAVSVYCECLRHNPFIHFDDYISSLNIDNFNWLRLYHVITEVFGEGSVKLHDFDQFEPMTLLDHLTPPNFSAKLYPLENNAELSRSTPDKELIDLLAYSSELFNPELAGKLFELIEESGLNLLMKSGHRFNPKNNFLEELDALYNKHYKEISEMGILI